MAGLPDHVRRSTADVFDDEHAVDDFDGVADGFAPGRIHPGDHRWSIHSEDPSIRSVRAHMADAPLSLAGTSRNSMHKSRDSQNPFSSTEDDDDSHDQDSILQRSHSTQSSSTAQYAPGVAHRLSTASSARTFARTASPMHGNTGPSHPYSMYPQDTNLGRTPSVSTTTSTIREAQPLTVSGQGPTHPYSMYPQNVSGHEDDADAATTQPPHAQTVIPVGFPGRNQGFVRTRGPEDEEQDIIGVDGHSEQLPPYSEYPEDGVPKTIVLPGQVVTPSSNTQVHLPLMQQQRQPESMSDQAAAHDLAEMQQLHSTESSSTSSDNKSWKDKTWKEKRKTRFCGVPFWWILLSLCVIAFIAIVLGAAIGGIFAGAKKQAEKAVHNHAPHRSTTLLDASPIPTSSIGAPPPTGVYALDFGPPQATQSACIANQNYSAAWACDIYGTPQMAIDIGLPPDGGSSEGACLYGFSNASGINYGTQPPNTQFAPFISVQDDDEPYRGPAFYFQTFYDKFVVVPENALPAASTINQKRSLIDPDWFTQHQVQAGDKPWFCWFNGTFLEGFIYANNYTSDDSSPSASLSSSSSSASSPSLSSPLTTSTIIEVSGPSTTTTLIPASQATAHTRRAVSGSYTHAAKRHLEKLAKRGWTFAELSSFGYVVKIEERRVPDSQQPYCNQYQILDNGLAGPLVDPSTNQQITVYLEETDPDYSAYQQQQDAAPSASSSKVKRDPITGSCHCEWWSGSS